MPSIPDSRTAQPAFLFDHRLNARQQGQQHSGSRKTASRRSSILLKCIWRSGRCHSSLLTLPAPAKQPHHAKAPAFQRASGSTLTLKLCPAVRASVFRPTSPELLLASASTVYVVANAGAKVRLVSAKNAAPNNLDFNLIIVSSPGLPKQRLPQVKCC